MKTFPSITTFRIKPLLGGISRVLVAAMVSIFAAGLSNAGEPPPIRVAVEPDKGRCEDNIPGVAIIDSKLDSPFFHKTTTSYHWQIVEHEDGHLENTLGGQITAEDLLRIEDAADCTSTHQGEHAMKMCDAVATKDGVALTIWGGMPAYASDLTVTIDHKLGFKCAFSAVYPGPSGPLQWKVTKKTLKLKSNKLDARGRLYGWISVEFEEIDVATKVSRAHKIEGYFKPVIQTAAVVEGVPKTEK